MDALWNGTKNLLSRSKDGQIPRLLVKVNYNEKDYHIGDLNALLKLESNVREEEIRDIADYAIDVTCLLETLYANKDKIKDIYLMLDERLTFKQKNSKIDIVKALYDLGLKINKTSL